LLSRVLDAPYHVRYGATGVPAPPRPGATVLDIGPGAGEELAEHARKGWEAWAVEPSPIAARAVAARAKIPAQRIIVAPAEEARLPAEQFDRVVMSHVIEHLSDPSAVLERVRGSMRPSATLTIRCPNFGSIERRLFGRWWAGLDVPRHLQHFTRETLMSLLAQSGLRAVKVRPQLDYASVSLSVGFMLRDVPRIPSSSRLDIAFLPVVALARALGVAGMLEVEAAHG
jgi:2-polyprenyl-3-methyl-5-hydroxy-6-metoxy-1,4-benzoquinol methylase